MCKQGDLWAASMVIRRGDNVIHNAALIVATSKDEAIGKAYRISEKAHPGECRRSIVVANEPIDNPEEAKQL